MCILTFQSKSSTKIEHSQLSNSSQGSHSQSSSTPQHRTEAGSKKRPPTDHGGSGDHRNAKRLHPPLDEFSDNSRDGYVCFSLISQ